MTNVKTTVDAAMSEVETRVQRSRHWRQPVRLWLAATSHVLAHVALVAFGITGVRLFLHGQKEMGLIALVALGLFTALRLLAGWLALSLRCQLCHGEVLRAKRCRLHRNAKKLPILSARMTAALSAMCTGHFTCMYCGSPYRLKQ